MNTEMTNEQAVIGNYRVKSLIAAGGMSFLYEAEHQQTGQVVVLKILRVEYTHDERTIKRFFREANALTQLRHPGLIAIHDVGRTASGQPYLVMELLRGRTLGNYLSEVKVISPDRAVPIFLQICDAMHYAHQYGIVHRDLKPENIMLLSIPGQGLRTKVLDFGILKLDDRMHDVSQRLTESGFICGSPHYISPEQIADDSVDCRADVYSMGGLMYRTLVGVPPVDGENVLQILLAQQKTTPRQLHEVRADMKFYPSLNVIVMHALEKLKEHRYQNMAQLREDLKVFASRIEQEIAAGISGQGKEGLSPLPFGSVRLEVPEVEAEAEAAADPDDGWR